MTTCVAKRLAQHITQSNNINCLISQFQRCKSFKVVLPQRLVCQGVDQNKYTIVGIPYPKDGGRGADGRVENRRVSGGCKQKYRMIDTARPTPPPESEKPVEEKVLMTRSDPLRTARIALVARGNHKRWIINTHSIKEGDLIYSHGKIPEIPVQGKVGDSHPLGALPLGAVIHNVEREPSEGGRVARAGGAAAMLVKKMDDSCLVRMPSGQEMIVNQRCIATLGKVQGMDPASLPMGSPNRMRWKGIKQRSGLFKKKTGYHGKKHKKAKPFVTYDKSVKDPSSMFED